MKQVYTIDGSNFEKLEEFYEEFSSRVLDGSYWGRNLDALDDVLCGGFGTPDNGFVLRWVNSETSREKLGYEETVRVFEQSLIKCHPLSLEHVRGKLAAAQSSRGQTVFDILIEIITNHGRGGERANDGVELLLE